MKYYNFIDLPNWKKHQQDLINFRDSNPPPDDVTEEFAKYTPEGQEVYVHWYCFFADEVEKELPDLYRDFKDMGLDLRQLIFFTNKPNDDKVTDPNNIMCPFIHIDAKDDEYDGNDETLFHPTNAINIPLENCENSYTTFYKIKEEEKHVFYPNFYLCGGLAPDSVEEVERFTLSKPAALRVNVPHAVLNPTNELRHVATFRFYNDTDFLFKV